MIVTLFVVTSFHGHKKLQGPNGPKANSVPEGVLCFYGENFAFGYLVSVARGKSDS